MEFERTECACAECVACCKRQPGPLAPGDLAEIERFLNLPRDDVRALFVASRGTLVQDRRTGARRWIGSITPARKANGTCVFLDDATERCLIHEVAPFGCAVFDTHMSAAESAPAASWLALSMESPLYQAQRAGLAPAKPNGGHGGN